MSASEDAPDDGPTEAELQALVDALPELANENADMLREVMRETATEQAAVGQKATPEGVPENYVYVPPGEEVGDEYDVTESPQGATYRSPSPSDGDDTDHSVSDLADGNPRSRIDTVEGAEEYLSEFDEDNFEYDHWRGGGNFDKVDEGSIVQIWTGDMGFGEENALVTGVDGDDYTVVTEDGVEKTMTPGMNTMDFDHTQEAPLADVWDDPANRASEGAESEVEAEDVEGDSSWFDDRDFESEYGAPEDVDITEGMPIEVGGEIRRVEASITENGIDYHELDDGQIMASVDGVLTKTISASNVDTGTEQYITWSDDAGLDDGWYAVDDDITETADGDFMVEMVDSDGEAHDVDGVAVERDGLIDRKHTPVDAAVVDPEMSGAHESYDASYPDSPSLESNVSLDGIADSLDAEQREQIERGLGKAQDLGITENVTAVTQMETEGEAAGMTLGRFEPESGEIKINTDRMNQETLDSVDDAFAVGDSVEDMLVHESIHAEHAQALEEGGMTPEEMREEFLRDGLPESEQELMEDAVSEYGAANPLEVVAEIGTQITRGEQVPDEALHLYEKYGGPEL